MTTNMIKKIYKLIFLIIVIGMFVWAIGGGAYTFYKNHISAGNSTFSYTGSEDYPIQLSYTEYRQYVENKLGNDILPVIETTDDGSSGRSILGKISNRITAIEEKIENHTNATNISQKDVFIKAKKHVDKITGLDMTTSLNAQTNDLADATDVVVETEEGQLGWVQDDTDISEELDNLIAFGLDMEEEGRNFIYFQNPNKYADSVPYTDYSEKYYNIVSDAFQTYGLDLYDFGEALISLGMTETDIFYNTDHHWKPSTGIIASKLMCEYLNENYGYSFDTSNFDLNQYTTETYENLFLGSLGQKVSTVYVEPDDFVVYSPIYETNLTVYRSFDDTMAVGTVSETLFYHQYLERTNLYASNAYSFYAYESQPLITVHNNQVNDGSHILIIKTSFANCMVPYLSTVVEDLEVIDLRHFEGSIQTYIDESNPDTVIVLTGISQMELDSAENSAFDFR